MVASCCCIVSLHGEQEGSEEGERRPGQERQVQVQDEGRPGREEKREIGLCWGRKK